MSKFITFTPEERDRASKTDLVELLQGRGEQLTRDGKEYAWRYHGRKISIRGNLWFDQYERKGGEAIGFVKNFFGLSFPDAMQFLLNRDGASLPSAVPQQLLLPQANDAMRRVTSYLVDERGINREILYAFIAQNMIYESRKYHNAVFVGYDNSGKPRHACQRSTGHGSSVKLNAKGSVPEYSFHWYGNDDSIYLFESPIDLLSYISMYPAHWRKHSYAASCSVSDRVLFQCLKDKPGLQRVFLCFDSDEPGQAAAQRISDKLFTRGYQAEILIPLKKDWNEDLLFRREAQA